MAGPSSMAAHPEAAEQLFAGPGEVRALCRGIDWEQTPLGPVSEWSQGLRMAVRLCLDARFPMAVWSGPDLVLIYNEGYPPVLGRDRHPWALGRPAREVWSTIWDQLGVELATVMGGESTWHEDQRFVIPRGGREEEAFFTYSFTPIQEADGRIVGALNVFTETTQRVKSLGAQEERYRALFECADDAIIVTDPKGSGNVVSANPAACSLFGYSEEEFRALDRSAMIEASDPGLQRLLIDRDEHGHAEAQLVYLRKDGSRFTGELRSTFFYDASGRRLAVGIIRDVTERRRAQAALRESEERYRRLFESIDEGFCIIEVLFNELGKPIDYRFLEMNPAFVAQTGLTDAKGRTMREMVPQQEEHWFEVYGRIALTGEPARFQMEARHLDPPRFYDVYAFRYGPADKQQVAVLFNDVAARKRAEEALKAANAQLMEADRAKNEFLGVLSHELRNPLAPIANSLYVLDHAAPGGAQAERARQVIGRQVRQLSNLVNDLLDVTRITRKKVQLQKERLELNEVVRRAVEDHRSMFERAGVHLELAPAPRPVPVIADATRLTQVVGNILQNAAKFTSMGGHTRVAISSEGSEAVMRVSDDGLGMPREIVDRLFEPFSQAEQALDRSRGGLGLGLALVRGLVELHGGAVSAESEGLGRGAEIVVRLPLDTGAAFEVADVASVPQARRRVLIIEDNADAADSLREALAFSEHEVVVAYNGPEGLSRAREFHPEVVLCDIGLPGMDGYDVARAFRADAALRDTFLVALSGYALPEDLRRAADAGFQRHLAKPPNLDKLEQLLSEVPRR